MESKKYLQFYADKQQSYSNKFFSFLVADTTEAFKLLLHFHCKGNSFRAIFIVTEIFNSKCSVKNSVEHYGFYNFFTSYDSSHFPTLVEAIRDYKIFIA
jgi:hypothetical protein